MNVSESAPLVGVSERQMRDLAPRLPGARKAGRDWDIPVSAVAGEIARRRGKTINDTAPEGTR